MEADVILDQDDYQAPVTCEDCLGHKNVTYFCLNCKGNLCESCKDKNLHRRHMVLLRTDPEVIKARALSQRPCVNHPKNQYVAFCNKCQKPCCVDCITDIHGNHNLISIEDAAKEARTKLESKLSIIKEVTLPQIENDHKAITNGIEKYNRSIEEVKEKSREIFHGVRKQLEQAEEKWLEQVQKIKTENLLESETLQENLEHRLNTKQQFVAACNSTLTKGSELTILGFHSEHKEIEENDPVKVFVPTPVYLEERNFTLPPLNKLIGEVVDSEKSKIVNFPQRYGFLTRTWTFVSFSILLIFVSHLIHTSLNSSFGPDMSLIQATTIKTIDKKGSVLMDIEITNESEVWISRMIEPSRTEMSLYDKNLNHMKDVEFKFAIPDMALTSSQDIIATDVYGKQLVRITRDGDLTTFYNTTPLYPVGICINDRQQLVVLLLDNIDVKSPFPSENMRMAFFSEYENTVVKQAEKYFTKPHLNVDHLLRVKQNGNGDYLFTYAKGILCLSRDGEYKWKYEVEGEVLGALVCDKYNNIIVGELINDRISLLNSGGQLVKTLMTKNDGIRYPLSLSIDKYGRLWIEQQDNIKVANYLN